MAKVLLREVAYARSGDKGDISTIGLMAKNANYYEQLKRELTPEKIKEFFNGNVKGDVIVHHCDNMQTFQVLCKGGLDGGATRTLRFDSTGKALGCTLQRMEVNID